MVGRLHITHEYEEITALHSGEQISTANFSKIGQTNIKTLDITNNINIHSCIQEIF